jgi:hypothetical protein
MDTRGHPAGPADVARIHLPPHLRGVFFDTVRDTARLWALPTPAVSLPIADLAWHLHLTVWTTMPGEPRFDLAPAQVLADPPSHARHWSKIQTADLAYPLARS